MRFRRAGVRLVACSGVARAEEPSLGSHLEHVELKPADLAVLALPNAIPDTLASIDFGVNGYAGNHAALKLHCPHTIYGEDLVLDGDLRGSEDAPLLQVQRIF